MRKIWTQPELDKQAEIQAGIFLLNRGIPIHRGRRSNQLYVQVPDYISQGTGYEVSSLYGYINSPYLRDLSSRLRRMGLDIDVLFYRHNSRLQAQVVRKRSCQINTAIIRQHFDISALRPKIYNKLSKEYAHLRQSKKGVIILDARTLGFDLSTLHLELVNILQNSGKEFPKLCGVMIGVSALPLSPIFAPLRYCLIENPWSPSYVPSELEDLSKVPRERLCYSPLNFDTFIKRKRGPFTIEYRPPHA